MSGPSTPIRGRGATLNPEGRFESRRTEPMDDGWTKGARGGDASEGTVGDARRPHSKRPPGRGATPSLDEGSGHAAALSDEDVSFDLDGESGPETEVFIDHARTIIARNESPDIPFAQSVNPYRGCEHGCVYCYARPSHAYLNLSPGLDFETKIFYKPDAVALLERELRKPGYRPEWISLGANTDPWQPVERRLGVTRGILELLARFRHPVGIVTKGAAIIARDIDLLADMARDQLVMVALSITTLDPELKRTLEPRAAAPSTRLRIVRMLAEAGVPVMVMFSPVIPFVNDAEMERVLEAARDAGARHASYTMLRLPYEVKDLFRGWLQAHMPLKADHVMSLVQQMRGGKDYAGGFGSRMKGQGPYADVIAQRFRAACRRLDLNTERFSGLSAAHFRVPPAAGDQFDLGL